MNRRRGDLIQGGPFLVEGGTSIIYIYIYTHTVHLISPERTCVQAGPACVGLTWASIERDDLTSNRFGIDYRAWSGLDLDRSLFSGSMLHRAWLGTRHLSLLLRVQCTLRHVK